MKNIAVLLILLIFFSINGFACDCIGGQSVKEALKNANAVLLGKVIKIEKFEIPSGYTNIKFYKVKNTLLVTKVYKGNIQTQTVEVVSGIDSGDCGFQFEINNNYIVYGYWSTKHFPEGDEVQKHLTTHICTRTTKEVQSEKIQIELTNKN